MQPIEVRRWRLAQVDFKLTMLLVRGAILMLGASGLYRSLETLIWVALAVVAFLVASLALRFPSTIILMSVMIRIRARQGSYSVASRAVEAMTWSDAITLGLSVVAALGFGAAAVWYEPFRSLWVIPPPPAAIAGSVVAVVAVVVSYFTEPGFSKKLFAYQDPYAESEPVQDGEDAE